MSDIFAELLSAITSENVNSGSKPPAPKLKVTPKPQFTAVSQASIMPADMPDVPSDFALAPLSAEPLKSTERSERMEALVDMALSKMEELLTIELDPQSDDFTKVASMQKDLVVSLVNTGVKIDENRFKKRQGDALTSILAKLTEREKVLDPLLELPVNTPPN